MLESHEIMVRDVKGFLVLRNTKERADVRNEFVANELLEMGNGVDKGTCIPLWKLNSKDGPCMPHLLRCPTTVLSS